MKLAEFLALERYKDFLDSFPGNPRDHGFVPWDESHENYRSYKIAAEQRGLDRLVERVRERRLKAALLEMMGQE
jgi:hypothetical protein